MHPVSELIRGKRCHKCSVTATHLLVEVEVTQEPRLAVYLCCRDFRRIVGSAASCGNRAICLMCPEEAVWCRDTQFAGRHDYCLAHAQQEEDWGQPPDPSYGGWRLLRDSEKHHGKPPF